MTGGERPAHFSIYYTASFSVAEPTKVWYIGLGGHMNKLIAWLKSMSYFSLDQGHGSHTGRWLYCRIGNYSLSTGLIVGPGNATSPGNDCGHSFPRCCNSMHCGQLWCKWRWSFVSPVSFRIWLGPTYHRTSIREWVRVMRYLAENRRRRPWCNQGTYSLLHIGR